MKNIQAFYENEAGDIVFAFTEIDPSERVHIKTLEKLSTQEELPDHIDTTIKTFVNKKNIRKELREGTGVQATLMAVNLGNDIDYIKKSVNNGTLISDNESITETINRGMISVLENQEEVPELGAISVIIRASKANQKS